MRALLTFLILLAALGAALFAFGAFESTSDTNIAGNTEGDGVEPDSGTSTDLVGDSPLTTDGSPKGLPAPQRLEFPEPTRVLMISQVPVTPLSAMQQELNDSRNVGWNVWYLQEGAKPPPGFASGGGMDALTSAPTGAQLDDFDYDVVILDNTNPADLPADFFDVLARRIRAGKTGLLYQAHFPFPGAPGADGKPLTRSPALDHPVLGDLLPVLEADLIAGKPDADGHTHVPGVFGAKPGSFTLLTAGVEHAATRIVQWPRWTRVHWEEMNKGAHAFSTPFVYPVTATRPGSRVLFGVDKDEGDPWPGLIEGAPDKGRVLWLGMRDLGWDAHYEVGQRDRLYSLRHNLLAWLAGADFPSAPDQGN